MQSPRAWTHQPVGRMQGLESIPCSHQPAPRGMILIPSSKGLYLLATETCCHLTPSEAPPMLAQHLPFSPEGQAPSFCDSLHHKLEVGQQNPSVSPLESSSLSLLLILAAVGAPSIFPAAELGLCSFQARSVSSCVIPYAKCKHHPGCQRQHHTHTHKEMRQRQHVAGQEAGMCRHPASLFSGHELPDTDTDACFLLLSSSSARFPILCTSQGVSMDLLRSALGLTLKHHEEQCD